MTAGFYITNVRPPGFVFAESWREAVEALHFGLAEIGLKAPILENGFLPVHTPIIFGAHHLAEHVADRLPPDAILYNFEQLVPGYPWHTHRYLSLLRRFRVWDFHLRNVRFLREEGISRTARFVPIGYVPQLSRIASAHEDVDVLFFGLPSERRQSILKEASNRKLKVVALRGVFGGERDQWIGRAKVVLNLHLAAGGMFESLRVLYLMANRKAVVTEADDPAEIDPGLRRGLCVRRYDRLVEACIELVEDDRKRLALANAGFQAVTVPNLRMSAFLREIPYLSRAAAP